MDISFIAAIKGEIYIDFNSIFILFLSHARFEFGNTSRKENTPHVRAEISSKGKLKRFIFGGDQLRNYIHRQAYRP